MGTSVKFRNTSCFIRPTLSGNDESNVKLKSRTVRELIPPTSVLGRPVILLFPTINEQISLELSDSGSEVKLLWFNKIRVHPEHSVSANVAKPRLVPQYNFSSCSAICIAKSRMTSCILNTATFPSTSLWIGSIKQLSAKMLMYLFPISNGSEEPHRFCSFFLPRSPAPVHNGITWKSARMI